MLNELKNAAHDRLNEMKASYDTADTGSDTDLKIHRLAVNNSSAGQISANAGWACQIRCCREVDEIE